MEKKVRLCMFDMGGVVVKHCDTSLERSILRDFGITDHDSFTSLDPALRSLLDQHSKDAIDEEEMWRQFSVITGIDVPPYKDSLWGRYFEPELDSHVLEIIQELKEEGYRVVCATNTEAAHYAHHRNADHYAIFDAVYASLQLKEVKPDRAFFDKILASEQVKPEETVFIDDLVENCETATKLGMNAFLYAGPVELRWDLASINLI